MALALQQAALEFRPLAKHEKWKRATMPLSAGFPRDGLFEIVEMKMDSNSFHVDYCSPNEHWPKGAWSVYQINGDQIADRVVRERVNPNGYYEGKIIARHSWCGYLGMYETLAQVVAAIEQHTTKLAA